MQDGILSEPIDLEGPRHQRARYPPVAAAMGLVVEHRASGRVGAIISFKPEQVVVRDRHGRDHAIVPRPGAFMIDGRPITLRRPTAHEKPSTTSFTASGSVELGPTPAKTARASRIWVEGLHDAELIEKVWGADLRVEGVVVEQLDGADDLVDRVARFGPRPGRRLAVLLDHLVEGTKEWRIAQQINHPEVLVVGHPYVDVWQTIRPGTAGIDEWPVIARGQNWKLGVMDHFGASGDPGVFWKRLLGRVEGFKDLEVPMVGAVEQMIDFVTAPS